ncbi:nineteen complex-related protein 2-domain-containing protein [Dipodascopsis tothii]|uniref:nineteen complex-related protein 2-domain-containing protein n=1 Tax=Dipodascopsis tothii TaxID=44089 RepID=UPI0034CE1FAE
MSSLGPASRFAKARANRRARVSFESDSDDAAEHTAQGADGAGDGATHAAAGGASDGTGAGTDAGRPSAAARAGGAGRSAARAAVSADSDDDGEAGPAIGVGRPAKKGITTAADLKKKKGRRTGLGASSFSSKVRSKLVPDLPGPGIVEEMITAETSAKAGSASVLSKYMDDMSALVPRLKEVRRQRMGSDFEGATIVDDDGDIIIDDHDEEFQRNQDFVRLEEEDEEMHIRTLNLEELDETDYHMAEGSDGRIPLSSRQAVEQQSARRQEMADAIEDFEDEGQTEKLDGTTSESTTGDSDSDWEDAQFRKGTFGARGYGRRDAPALGPDPGIDGMILQPMPTVDGALARLQTAMEAMRVRRAEHEAKLVELESDRASIAVREGEIQLELDKAAPVDAAPGGAAAAAEPVAVVDVVDVADGVASPAIDLSSSDDDVAELPATPAATFTPGAYGRFRRSI